VRTALLYAGFALTGVVTTMLGPLLPTLISAWSIDDARAGTLFTAQFTGALVGLAATSALLGRLGVTRLIVGGFAVVALGVIGLAAGGWPAGAAAVFAYGAGLSLVIPTINLHVAETNPERRAEALNVLNFVWGAGALVSPFLVRGLGRFGLVAPLAVFSFASAAVAAALAAAPADEAPRKADVAGPRPRAWRDPLLALVCAISYLYVGAENAVSGWVVAYVERRETAPAFAGALAFSLFWGALLVGRAAAPLALRATTGPRLVLAGAVVATAGAAALPAAGHWAAIAAAAAVAGLGFATILPTTFATFMEHFGERAERIVSLVFVSSTLGGATLPWCVGAVSARAGDLRLGLLVPVAACLAMVALQAGVLAILRRD
jgi:fucose permease